MAAPDLGANLVQMFDEAALSGHDRPFLWARRTGTYAPWSWRRVADESRRVAACLADLGVAPGDRVLIVGENRPEWCIADLAVLRCGAVSVPAYTTNTADEHGYLLQHSEAKAVIIAGPHLARQVVPAVRQASSVRALLSMEALDGLAEPGLPAVAWEAALARGALLTAPAVGTGSSRDDLACFIYTSGTGGRPKGVMLSHGNIMANLRGAWALLEKLGLGDEVFLSFLPLSHAYEHTAGQFLPMALRAQIYYADGVEALSTNLIEARPTVLPCVPRLYEVLRQRITSGVERKGGLAARLFHLALALGQRRYESGGRLPPHLALVDRTLDRLVRDKIRARFGGRLKAMVSGGAPLNYEVGLFFVALGLPVFQGYGQTEAAPVVSVNVPGRSRLDTVGPPFEGVEVRLAEDGELLIRGELVMKGYWKDPEGTARALRGGWLHTGDIAELDPDGYIRITDRKRDIIVNSGGDNIAPARVEGTLLLEPEIGQVLVYGDRRPHLVALLVPHAEFAKAFARAHRKDPDLTALAADGDFKAAIAAAVARANRKLSTIERIRRHHVMPEPFSIENGMMTPTLKLRRHLIIEAHQPILEGLYGTRASAGAAT